jgi:glutamate-1-semialdehyde 2,1-aminomutase
MISYLEKEYMEKHPGSRLLYERAMGCFASGVTHDSRYARPFPIYAVKARGTRKWDVDGNEYVDYIMGHGALIFGYGDERVEAVLQEQIPKAIHMGASTELEIEWAELIKKLVPCAREGLVRAASSGTEANMLAIRMARIYTDRDKIAIHAGSYHGTLDATLYASRGPPFGKCNVRGIPDGVKKDVIILPYNNLEVAGEAFEAGDVACVILQGNALYTKEYIEGLRKLTRDYGVVFIIDEVVSGFRYAAGGAQEYYGVIPDLATLGKIVGGGVPVGAICGRREIMEVHAFKDEYWNRFVRISAGGTWNAQPISIVGGIAMMKIIDSERSTIYPTLYKIGHRLTKSFNDMAEDMGVAATTSGLPPDNPTTFSLHFFRKSVPGELKYLWHIGPKSLQDYDTKAGFSAGGQATYVNYLALINNGVYAFPGSSFILCTKYTEEDLSITEGAFEASLKALKNSGLVGSIK